MSPHLVTFQLIWVVLYSLLLAYLLCQKKSSLEIITNSNRIIKCKKMLPTEHSVRAHPCIQEDSTIRVIHFKLRPAFLPKALKVTSIAIKKHNKTHNSKEAGRFISNTSELLRPACQRRQRRTGRPSLALAGGELGSRAGFWAGTGRATPPHACLVFAAPRPAALSPAGARRGGGREKDPPLAVPPLTVANSHPNPTPSPRPLRSRRERRNCLTGSS